MPIEEEPLSPIVSLDLRFLNAVITDDEGDVILLVDDGEVQIELNPGVGGGSAQAIIGAQKLASTALEYAATIRRRPSPT